MSTRKTPKRVPVHAFVDREQAEAAERLAKREDRSVSSIVRQALRGYLERLTSATGEARCGVREESD